MKNRIVTVWAVLSIFGVASLTVSRAQFPMSFGPYVQNFDGLAAGGTGNLWTDNSTLMGWYAAKTLGGPVSGYNAGTGSANTGALYSFGVAGVNNVSDRALGSIASGTPGNFAYGLRLTNDTPATFTNVTVTYTGEQWRNGGVAAAHTLAFSYRISSTAITDADAANLNAWTSVSALNFVTPTAGGTASALDGNAVTNRQTFDILLPGATVGPGQEIFFRWRDVDDTGGDHGFGIDDLTILYNLGEPPVLAAPTFNVQPQSQTAAAGEMVQFNAAASGNPAPVYQWQFNGTNLIGQTGLTLTLNSVTTNQGGSYRVVATNSQGSATSEVATLTVTLPVPGVSLLTYNVKGNGATNWSTNAAQVQAIARQLQYLQPDVITFNEIPFDLRYEMTNFIAAFLPNYNLAVSSGTDGSIVSAIASRYPITRSSKWLDGIDLRSFGYSNANNALDNFTRDLFEAQIAVPGFARPLHVFTTHLKATSSSEEYADNAAKRAAEATAITNFLATNIFAQYPYDLYVLTGDMNANDTNELCIQKLLSPPTGLTMTGPKNPVTGSINTYSTTTANPSSRLDYIFPGPMLYSNIKTSQVFRTDRLTPLPPNLNSNDCKVASDHLPVLMVFNNPYDKPFKLLSITRANPTVTLKWESVFGQPYRVESSTNLTMWTTQANNLVATGTNYSYSTNLSDTARFFRVYRMP
jgi:endonuclease/exonuclease/phosphatase family metal-dependent hydrolase